MVGRDLGKIVPYDEVAGGGGTDSGWGVELGRVDATGNPHDFSSSYLFGFRRKGYASVDVRPGVSVGLAVARSEYNGEAVWVTAIQGGLGGSPFKKFSGGYNHGVVEKK